MLHYQGESFSGLSFDSRKVASGDLFFALKGAKVDGRKFAIEAEKRGARAVVAEEDIPGLKIKLYIDPNPRKLLTKLSHDFFGFPTKQLETYGITGTNGKTSTAWILSELRTAMGHPTAYLGTLGFYIDGKLKRSFDNTSPDPITLCECLKDAIDSGQTGIAIEVTSQAIAQYRMDFIDWDAVAFTNLTRDHLDLHGTMENYGALKRELVTSFIDRSQKANKHVVLNFDDSYVRETKVKNCVSLSTEIDADFEVVDHEFTTNYTNITLRNNKNEYSFKIPFIGKYNVENVLTALILLNSQGHDFLKLVSNLQNIRQVPGRLERVGKSNIYVDYAHTPDALKKVLEALNKVKVGKIITVFGCGGDRDRGKRPVMAEIASSLSDLVVVTSDNPRSEDPQSIVSEIATGIVPKVEFYLEVDRREAIGLAISKAHKDDIILIAGKGHEDYQEIMGVKHHFSDQEIVAEIIGA